MTTSKSTPTYPPNYALRKRDQRMKKYARPKWCRNWLRSQKGKWSKWKWILPLSFGFSCGLKKVSYLKIKCGNTWEFVRKLLIKSFHLKSRPRRISTLIFFSCNYVQQLKKQLAKRKSRSLSLFYFRRQLFVCCIFPATFPARQEELEVANAKDTTFCDVWKSPAHVSISFEMAAAFWWDLCTHRHEYWASSFGIRFALANCKLNWFSYAFPCRLQSLRLHPHQSLILEK